MSEEVLVEKKRLTLVITSPLSGRIPILVDDILEPTKITDGIQIRWYPVIRGGGTEDVACYLIELAKGLVLPTVTGILSGFIHEKFKGIPDLKLEIEGLNVHQENKEHIQRILTEKLKQS
ncbi:hypothetical protein MUP59_05585 [Candidatus Bathyarchaeota archaeon]|nr:hypothetical protein [Candidatus Bathyarchaeota archaeon]